MCQYLYIYWFHGFQIHYYRPQVAPNPHLEAVIGSKARFGSHKWLEMFISLTNVPSLAPSLRKTQIGSMPPTY